VIQGDGADRLLDRVHNLMMKMRNSKCRGRLRQKGMVLTPLIRGHKWGATYMMVHRFFEMKDAIYSVLDDWAMTVGLELESLRLDVLEIQTLIALRATLKSFYETSIAIQAKTGQDLGVVRATFDIMLELHATSPQTEDALAHLKPTHSVISQVCAF